MKPKSNKDASESAAFAEVAMEPETGTAAAGSAGILAIDTQPLTQPAGQPETEESKGAPRPGAMAESCQLPPRGKKMAHLLSLSLSHIDRIYVNIRGLSNFGPPNAKCFRGGTPWTH
ncbi:MAG: hypothetical protein NTY38_23045 [Acidobacteria bacterium]|nr:hypothetical protein [Acidobacteriota bacterium]